MIKSEQVYLRAKEYLDRLSQRLEGKWQNEEYASWVKKYMEIAVQVLEWDITNNRIDI
jgi:hypothetical protein